MVAALRKDGLRTPFCGVLVALTLYMVGGNTTKAVHRGPWNSHPPDAHGNSKAGLKGLRPQIARCTIDDGRTVWPDAGTTGEA